MSKRSPDKMIVSNCAQLTQKYAVAGLNAIGKAVKQLIKADAARGIEAVFIDLSDAATMNSYGAPVVSAANGANAKLNKQAIDKVIGAGDIRPAYLMLLGSTDVIPHVALENPVDGDGDPDVPSDLPYACDKPYSTDVQDFIAPTRVVGRLPNVTGDNDAGYLTALLGTAAAYMDRPATAYGGFLGISAQVWKNSSQLSLDAIFGTHAGMKISPPDGYKWSAAEAKRLSHFVNCHGAPGDPSFYGQKGASYPVAHSAEWMSTRVAEGTIMAAECCYGAELYDPDDPFLPTAGGQMGMCNTYLADKAYAYFGSSTIAYGPDATNDQADLMCQYFLQGVLAGASAGRACLQARLQYVNNKVGVLAPTDLKTIAQFNLMADPSITPVSGRSQSTVIPSARSKSMEAAQAALSRHALHRRRKDLEMRAATASAYRLLKPTARDKTTAFAKLRKLAAEHGIKAPDVVLSYGIGEAFAPRGRKGFAAGASIAALAPKAVHVILERRNPPNDLPHLRLIRGIQAVEFEEGMVAQPFESR